MPGIFGIVSKHPDGRYEHELKAMQETMLHESFYSTGTWIEKSIGFYGGWTCHEDSFCDCLPVFNETRDLVLLFSGEDISHLENQGLLAGKDHSFKKSDASYLVHLYEEKGEAFLDDINGLFHGIIIDLKKKTLLLFNDRYGMQRIYYHEAPDAFYFSSEAKAILKVRPELRTFDDRSLGEFLTCNCVLEWRTLFKGIFLLPGASAWKFSRGKLEDKGRYFDPEQWESQQKLEPERFYKELRETFREILPRYFRAEQEIGISLTGGLDTRMILANVDTPPGQFPCYTFSGKYRESRDVKVARKVAKACGQNFQAIEVGDRFLREFPVHAEKTVYVSDGNHDVSGSPEIYVNRLARQISPIRITGTYGGELLRNLRVLKSAEPDRVAFSSGLLLSQKKAAETFSAVNGDNPLSFTLFLENPWLQCNRQVIESSQLVLRTPFLDNELASLLYRAPEGFLAGQRISRKLILEGDLNLSRIYTDRGIGSQLPPPFPLLPRMFHEIFFKFEYYYNYGMPQWLAKIDYLLKPCILKECFSAAINFIISGFGTLG